MLNEGYGKGASLNVFTGTSVGKIYISSIGTPETPPKPNWKIIPLWYFKLLGITMRFMEGRWIKGCHFNCSKLSGRISSCKDVNGLLLFEKHMENYLTNLLKERVKRMPYGPEIIFAYVHAKEIEIKNLRIALVGRANGLSPDFIKERLRETYV